MWYTVNVSCYIHIDRDKHSKLFQMEKYIFNAFWIFKGDVDKLCISLKMFISGKDLIVLMTKYRNLIYVSVWWNWNLFQGLALWLSKFNSLHGLHPEIMIMYATYEIFLKFINVNPLSQFPQNGVSQNRLINPCISNTKLRKK